MKRKKITAEREKVTTLYLGNPSTKLSDAVLANLIKDHRQHGKNYVRIRQIFEAYCLSTEPLSGMSYRGKVTKKDHKDILDYVVEYADNVGIHQAIAESSIREALILAKLSL